jgi:hypothetical protein
MRFSAHFALLILAKSTLGALLKPLFGQSQKNNSRKFAKKVAMMSLEALRDTYGGTLCLPVCYRDPKPSIRCAKVLASKITSIPGGGK